MGIAELRCYSRQRNLIGYLCRITDQRATSGSVQMNTRILEGFEISDEAVYAFGDLTAVVTFKSGVLSEIFVAATYGDFSDAALLDVVTNGKPLGDVQKWLAYIEPDLMSGAEGTRRSAIDALMPEAAQTFSGQDGAGKGWIIGFDGEAFVFASRETSGSAHYILQDDLCVLGDQAITSRRLDVNTFVVNGPSAPMLQWIRSKLKETAR